MSVPIPRPGKIVCVGLNYKDNAEEQGAELHRTVMEAVERRIQASMASS